MIYKLYGSLQETLQGLVTEKSDDLDVCAILSMDNVNKEDNIL